MAELEIGKDEILFVGDRLDEDGNDYPVKAMGIAALLCVIGGMLWWRSIRS